MSGLEVGTNFASWHQLLFFPRDGLKGESEKIKMAWPKKTQEGFPKTRQEKASELTLATPRLQLLVDGIVGLAGWPAGKPDYPQKLKVPEAYEKMNENRNT